MSQHKDGPKPPEPSSEQDRGQISVMIGVMMTTFILLFAFVVNTGMLVNAKINLQNAADLAAYAGASVQARQLTHISYLNYEMRRQWKKLLFRLYVIGNMAQDSFPFNGGGHVPMVYQPNQNAGNSTDYLVPSTCIIFNGQDNYCHLPRLPAISIPPPSFFDSISDTLHEQLSAIELIRQKNCQAIGQTNKFLNIYWLFNGDPTTQSLEAGLDPDQQNVIRITRELIRGVGIVPREIILKFRINTLKDYINQDPQKSLDFETMKNLQSSLDPAMYERSIQAFNSAYYTLGNHIFSTESIFLDELSPKFLLGLNEISTKVDTVTIDQAFGTQQAGGAASKNPAECVAKRLLVSLNGELPVGFWKDPNLLTYYAIRLKAKAHILFSPFGDMQLKAYSAAQPFGSRIGPRDAKFTTKADVGEPGTPTIDLPNLPVMASDTEGRGSGWDTKDVVGTMFRAMGAPIAGLMSGDALVQAYALAMAPNPWEKGKYNIITDAGEDHFIRNFDVRHMAGIWAPVVSAGSSGGLTQQIKSVLEELFPPTLQGNVGFTGTAVQNLKGAVTSSLSDYISSLNSGGGENGETMNVAALENPLISPHNGQPVEPGPLIMSDPKDLKTSWNDVNDGNFIKEGRTGYSVKFIAFTHLDKQKIPAGGGGAIWTNGLTPDSDLEGDLPFILH